jgi:AcrR family transcriptional regulator
MDRRIRKTETTIQEALVSLLNTRGLAGVTVGDIVAKADLNRSTFYLHYQSVDDVLLALEDRVSANLMELVRVTPKENLVPALISYVHDHQENLFALFNVSSYRFETKIQNVFKPLVKGFLKPRKDAEWGDYAASYLLHGLYGIFAHWVNTRCHYSEEKLAKAIGEFLAASKL